QGHRRGELGLEPVELRRLVRRRTRGGAALVVLRHWTQQRTQCLDVDWRELFARPGAGQAERRRARPVEGALGENGYPLVDAQPRWAPAIELTGCQRRQVRHLRGNVNALLGDPSGDGFALVWAAQAPHEQALHQVEDLLVD